MADLPPDGVLLYRLQNPDVVPQGTSPAPHCDLLRRQDIGGIVRLLMIFRLPPLRPLSRPFKANGYAIWVTHEAAFIPIAGQLEPTRLCRLEQLISLLPGISKWLAQWATSLAREPCLAPSWAAALRLDEQMVQAIAEQISSTLATAKDRLLHLSDMLGHDAELAVPPVAMLRAPSAASTDGNKRFRVATVESSSIGLTPGGQKIVFCNGAQPPQEETLHLQLSDLHPAHISVPRHVVPVGHKEDKE